jgi:hypothetical protein
MTKTEKKIEIKCTGTKNVRLETFKELLGQEKFKQLQTII